MELDWGLGAYEETAEQLRPASEAVVELAGRLAGPLAGRRVLDVGCGSGNAALLAAAAGAKVTAVDPAERLLQVARARAERDGLTIEFVPGEAGDLPVPDGSAEVVLSVFAVIFAPDPAAAIAELARVTAPAGHIFLAAWLPGGPLAAIAETAGKFVAAALQPSEQPAAARQPAAQPFAWHEPEALRTAFQPYGFEVEVERRQLTVRHVSPAAYVADAARHPMAVTGRLALAALPNGEELIQELQDRLVQVTTERNEDPAAFRVTNDYCIVTARHRR